MIMTILPVHRQRFDEIKKRLQALGFRESEFVKVELLFYEAMDIAKTYGDDPQQNTLLAALKNLHGDEYEKTKAATRKAGERESAIRRFIVALKRILSHTN
jgi:hypothetical protein